MENNNDLLNSSDDENLKMENELLRLKLMAQFGGDSHSTGNLDPAMENAFLNHVMAFEQNYASAKCIKIFDLLGKPDFKPVNELGDDLIEQELSKAIALLSQNNIEIDFEGTYDSRTKYSFITEELFDHETDNFKIPGMVTHFSYEEFHPNHKLDIENRALEFLTEWFEQKLNEHSWCLSNHFILPDKRILSKNEVSEKLNKIFESYKAFTDTEYFIRDINFDINDETGIGYAEGHVKYNAVLENNECLVFNGPFKLYFELQYGWWSIFHIVFPGFEY